MYSYIDIDPPQNRGKLSFVHGAQNTEKHMYRNPDQHIFLEAVSLDFHWDQWLPSNYWQQIMWIVKNCF